MSEAGAVEITGITQRFGGQRVRRHPAFPQATGDAMGGRSQRPGSGLRHRPSPHEGLEVVLRIQPQHQPGHAVADHRVRADQLVVEHAVAAGRPHPLTGRDDVDLDPDPELVEHRQQILHRDGVLGIELPLGDDGRQVQIRRELDHRHIRRSVLPDTADARSHLDVA